MDAEQYCQLVELGPCPDDKKIRNDTFRTFKGNEIFWARVDESKLSRVLTVCSRTNANSSDKTQIPSTAQSQYVQGMNVLVGPFLYVMPEVDAYAAFMTLITRHCPRYVASNLDGTHHGCSLIDRTLEILDPILHQHIVNHILRPEIFAFPFVMTLLACMTPLHEVLCVWDAIFAFGIHFDILLVTAHLMLLRDLLLSEQQAFRIQKMIAQEPLDSQLLIGCAVQLVRFVPSSLFEELISHPVDRPSNLSQVLSRDYHLSAQSAQSVDDTDTDEDHSILSKKSTKSRLPARPRPLSGRLSKRTSPSSSLSPANSQEGSLTLVGAGDDADGGRIGRQSRRAQMPKLDSDTADPVSLVRTRSSSGGRSKLRVRSGSRNRGKVRETDQTSARNETATAPSRRPRIATTSQITTEKSSLSRPLSSAMVATPSHHSPSVQAHSKGHITPPPSPNTQKVIRARSPQTNNSHPHSHTPSPWK